MGRMRFFSLLTALCCLMGVVGAAFAAEVGCDEVYCFTQEDFSEDELEGICVLSLPDGSQGLVMLGDRQVRPGDILTAEQVEQMTFQPLRTEEDAAASVTYLPVYSDRVEEEAVMTITIRGKEDKAPVAEDIALETYKNLPLEGKLKVSDPEGQSMTYTVTRQPRRGSVTVGADGSFTYTPKKNKVGVDSFTFTATDPAGKVSREATVTITILKPTEAAQYTDTVGKDCRFAAEWMKHTGIFVGESLAENPCFQPEKQVTRGEFITMMVKTLQIPLEEGVDCAGYTDQVPQWLRPYVAAAVRSGLLAQLPAGETFDPDGVISGEEAAVMLQNALDLSVQASAEETEQGVLAVMNSHGFALTEGPLTRGEVAMALYQATRLADSAPGMRVIRMQR